MGGKFERYELKFLISREQKLKLIKYFSQYITPDSFGKSTICNLYFDTKDFLLIRRSIEKPVYKEKLRLRSYGVAKENSDVYLELKKKYKKVVYKRRISLKLQNACNYFDDVENLENCQIAKEIDYTRKLYKTLEPRVFISYDREAFFAKNESSLRTTFDENILWRNYDLSLQKGIYGEKILDFDTVLMEIKISGALPLWLISFLSENKIYKTSFSKYGRAYKKILIQNKEKKYAI